jgi:hypothetical protein
MNSVGPPACVRCFDPLAAILVVLSAALAAVYLVNGDVGRCVTVGAVGAIVWLVNRWGRGRRREMDEDPES